MNGICELCERKNVHLTRHHLIPRKYHSNKRLKRIFSREEMQTRLLWVCRSCHSYLHSVISEKELAEIYNHRESLLSHQDIAAFIAWLGKKPSGYKPKIRRKNR